MGHVEKKTLSFLDHLCIWDRRLGDFTFPTPTGKRTNLQKKYKNKIANLVIDSNLKKNMVTFMQLHHHSWTHSSTVFLSDI